MENERNAVRSAAAVRVRRCSSAMRDVSPTVDCTFDRQVNQQIAAGGGLVLTLRTPVGTDGELVQLRDVERTQGRVCGHADGLQHRAGDGVRKRSAQSFNFELWSGMVREAVGSMAMRRAGDWMVVRA